MRPFLAFLAERRTYVPFGAGIVTAATIGLACGVSMKIKDLVREQGGLCHYCLRTMLPPGAPNFSRHPAAASRDHVIPVSRGGTNRRVNIVGACRKCNGAKGCQTGAEFIAAMIEIPPLPPTARRADRWRRRGGK